MKWSIWIFAILILLTGCNKKSNHDTVPVPEPTPPTAPSALTTRAISYDTISLAWVDNGIHETQFHIERSEDGGSTFIPIADVAGDSVEYHDSGLREGQYTYRVNASNDEGVTEYSNESQVNLWAVDACLDTPVGDPAIASGYFFDLPIYGLNYTTPDQTSFTDANGRFYFGTASTTQFYLGYTPLGTVTNAPYVRFKDLAASLGATSMDDRVALNLLSLLQTLDSDNDAFNGIQIPCALSLFPYREIDFTLHESTFVLQPGIAEMLAGKPMVSNATARNTFETLLNLYYAGTYAVNMRFLLDGIPVTFAFTMTVSELGELTLNNLSQPYSLSFNPSSGVFSALYTDLEPLLIYFVLTEVYGLNLDLGDLPQYYPLLFTVYGSIRPDHTIGGESVLYTLSGEYKANIQGMRQ